MILFFYEHFLSPICVTGISTFVSLFLLLLIQSSPKVKSSTPSFSQVSPSAPPVSSLFSGKPSFLPSPFLCLFLLLLLPILF